ncbi:aspartic peptidase domain-containing protein [Pilobolus umbonatus]|nr:aspartic peptidase domain-containing protein [Pilobolus umbonatus]
MVDTGSTLIFLPKDIIANIFKDVKGIRRNFSGQYIVPCSSTDLPDIIFTLNNQDLTLKASDYIIKEGTLAYSTESCYTYLQESPPYVDAILGYGFLQQFVSIYDNGNQQMGFVPRASIDH